MKTSEVARLRRLGAVVQPVHGAGGVAGHDGAEPEGEVFGLRGSRLSTSGSIQRSAATSSGLGPKGPS